MEQLLTFKRFHTAEEAAEIISILVEHNLPAFYEEEVVLMDKVYIGQNFDQRHLVKIPAEYFTKADELLKNLITVSIDDVEPDYYLLSFSSEELADVIANKDEWGDYDYALALKLLEKKGVTYTSQQLNNMATDRNAQLSEPKNLDIIWMVIGYISPLAIFSALPYGLLFSFLGAFIGAFVRLTKKTLPDGSRIYAFSENSRKHGLIMIILGAVLIPLFLFVILTVVNR